MDSTLAAAGGALLVALLNEARAQLRAKQADRDRQALRREAAGGRPDEQPTPDDVV